MGKVIWLQLQIWTQMFLILKKLINKTFYLITFLWITDQGMTITAILNLLHLVYKYVVLFCESSSADTACKFLEVFLVQRWQNYFKNMLQKSQRTWTSTIWNYTCSMLAKKVGWNNTVQMVWKTNWCFLSIKELLHSYYTGNAMFQLFCDLMNIKSDLSGKTINYLLIKNFLTNHIDN